MHAIFDAIKSDDAQLFGSILSERKQNISLCLGRFPLLSLCYLYRARKIVRIYGDTLATIENFERIDEPVEAYHKFKEFAGTSLRLYDSESIVMPAEMLAILRETEYLKQVFTRLKVDRAATDNLVKIYAARGQTALVEGNVFKATSERLPWKARFLCLTAAVTALFFIAVTAISMMLVKSYIGAGTAKNPFKIYSATQLADAADSNSYYALQTDLILPDDFAINTFAGKLDGGGHVIKAASDQPFADEITGQIFNLIYEFSPDQIIIEGSHGFFTQKNSGTLSAITLKFDTEIIINDEGLEDVALGSWRIAGLAAENYGEINSCIIAGKVDVSSSHNADACFAGAVGINYGLIKDTTIAEDSVFSADTVDIAGVVAENAENAQIVGCVNAGKISQSTTSEFWNPNSAGIVIFNVGKIIDCRNDGEISSQTLVRDKAGLEVFASGIVSVNYGSVSNSQSYGKVFVGSVSNVIYGGGIAAVNLGLLQGNSCYATISAATEQDVNIFLGGIVGLCGEGELRNNYSEAVFDCELRFNTCLGGIIGCAYVYWYENMYYLFAAVEDNFYMPRQNVTYGVAVCYLTSAGRFVTGGNIDGGIMPISSGENT